MAPVIIPPAEPDAAAHQRAPEHIRRALAFQITSLKRRDGHVLCRLRERHSGA